MPLAALARRDPEASLPKEKSLNRSFRLLFVFSVAAHHKKCCWSSLLPASASTMIFGCGDVVLGSVCAAADGFGGCLWICVT
jgi:hypothetical protein